MYGFRKVTIIALDHIPLDVASTLCIITVDEQNWKLSATLKKKKKYWDLAFGNIK